MKISKPSSAGPSKAAHRPEAVAQSGIRLGFLIHDVSRLRRTAFDQLMKPFGVTRAQWWVLAHLSRHDGMVQTRLAESLEVGKASIGALLERLERQGLVERRADPVDGRAKRVYLARRGRTVLRRMMLAEHALNDAILGGLTPAACEALGRNLAKVKLALLALIGSDAVVPSRGPARGTTAR